MNLLEERIKYLVLPGIKHHELLMHLLTEDLVVDRRFLEIFIDNMVAMHQILVVKHDNNKYYIPANTKIEIRK